MSIGFEGSYVKGVSKFGHQSSSVTSEVLVSNMGVSGPAYLSAPQKITLSSENTTDTQSGTGARAITIEGTGSGYIEQREEVWLLGQGAASTQLEWLTVDRLFVSRVGSNQVNAGQVWAGYGTITTGVPASKLALITSLDGQTEQLNWTIPVSHEAHVHVFEFASSKVSGADSVATFRARIKNVDSPDRSWRTQYIGSVVNGSLGFASDVDGLIIAGPALIEVRANTTVAAALNTGIVIYELHKRLQG